jgi:hypothetical protein
LSIAYSLFPKSGKIFDTNKMGLLYKWLEQKVTYAGIKQRWLIVEGGTYLIL